MIITSVQQYNNLPAKDYFKLEGYSTSFLKKEQFGVAEDFVMTDKIRIGSLVDSILTDPAKADMGSSLYPIAKNIAHNIKEKFGELFKMMLPQVSFTGTMEHGDFKMPTKGRLDFLLPGHAVIDLKVTDSKNIAALIDFMKYKEQMFLYCKFAGVTKAYLFFYCVPLKKCSVHYIDCSGRSAWWEEKTLKFGK